jgi:hypothetical protein
MKTNEIKPSGPSIRVKRKITEQMFPKEKVHLSLSIGMPKLL